MILKIGHYDTSWKLEIFFNVAKNVSGKTLHKWYLSKRFIFTNLNQPRNGQKSQSLKEKRGKYIELKCRLYHALQKRKWKSIQRFLCSTGFHCLWLFQFSEKFNIFSLSIFVTTVAFHSSVWIFQTNTYCCCIGLLDT